MGNSSDPVQIPLLRALLTSRSQDGGGSMMGSDDNLDELLRRCAAGDGRAAEAVVLRLEGQLLRLAAWVLRDPVAAEDVFIEVMTRLIPRFAEFDSGTRLVAYSRRAVRNQCIDTLRNKSARDSRIAMEATDRVATLRAVPGGRVIEEIAHARENPEGDYAAAERVALLRDAMGDLGEPARTIVHLFYDQALTYEQISDRLGISVSGVKRHLGGARSLLAARLRGRGVQNVS